MAIKTVDAMLSKAAAVLANANSTTEERNEALIMCDALNIDPVMLDSSRLSLLVTGNIDGLKGLPGIELEEIANMDPVALEAYVQEQLEQGNVPLDKQEAAAKQEQPEAAQPTFAEAVQQATEQQEPAIVVPQEALAKESLEALTNDQIVQTQSAMAEEGNNIVAFKREETEEPAIIPETQELVSAMPVGRVQEQGQELQR